MEWLEGFEQVLFPQSRGGTFTADVTRVVWHCTAGWCAEHAFNVYAAAPKGACPNITAEYAGSDGVHASRDVTKRRFQHVPLNASSYSLQRGDANHVCNVQTNRHGVIQIERVGFPYDNVTDDEHRWLGEQVLAPILRECPNIPPSVFQGMARMDEREWSEWPGGQCRHANVCCQPDGHADPPELDLDLILHYALEHNLPPILKDDDMVILVLANPDGTPSVADGIFAYNGTHLRWVNDGNEYAMLRDDVKAAIVAVSDVKIRATIASTAKVGGAPTSGRYAGAW